MAKYDDYARPKDESLDKEIDKAAKDQKKREDDGFDIPEQFKGKTAEEIAKSYVELQKLNSRQANDLGQLRKSFDTLVQSELIGGQGDSTSKEPEDDPVTIDDLYEDTEKAISRVAEKTSKDRLAKLEQELQSTRLERQYNEFIGKHPDYQELAQDPEFQNWVVERPYRVRLMQQADQYDFDAADELLTFYKDFKGIKGEEDKRQRDAELDAAELETGTPRTPNVSPKYSRSEIVMMKARANKGDNEALQWLRDNSAGIHEAYREKRFVD